MLKRIARSIYHFFYPFFDLFKSSSMKKKIVLKEGKIHLVFICQCENIFDKIKYFVSEAHKNEAFIVSLFIVPDTTPTKGNIFEQYAKENDIDFYHYEEGLLKKISPSLVCYTRPYDHYLPEDIRSKVVSKYCKTTYIPYGYSFMDLGRVNLSHQFTRNISLFFADNSYSYNYFKRHNKVLLNNKALTCVDVGYPYFEDLHTNFVEYCKGQKTLFKNKNRIKAIWTPRWTSSEKLGGSNFLRYIDNMFDYFVNNDDFDFVFRPHPYAFSNYIETGVLTKETADGYIDKINKSSNSTYDNNDLYLNLFNESDVLITDISSIIAEYMFTKKPIIFCHNEGDDIVNEVFKKYEKCFYHAYSFEDIKAIMEDLKDGKDPLKDDRERLFADYSDSFKGTSERMIECILDLKDKWYKRG